MLLYLLGIILSITANAQQRVAIIDTGLNIHDAIFKDHLCPDGHKDFTKKGLNDVQEHGTHVTGLIQTYAKDADYCFVIIKYFHTWDDRADEHLVALSYAVEQNVSIINISSSGESFSSLEYLSIYLHPEITFVVAAGNQKRSLDDQPVYPASYQLPNVVTVGNGVNKLPQGSSNWGSVVDVWEDGENVMSNLPGGHYGTKSGTSMSTAIHTGKLIYERHQRGK